MPKPPAPKKPAKPSPSKPRAPVPAVVLVATSPADLARDALRDAVHRRAPRSLPVLIALTRDLNDLTTSALVGDYVGTLDASTRLRDAEARLKVAMQAIGQLRAMAGAARDGAQA